jgi:DNA polymerase-3 subunit delta'
MTNEMQTKTEMLYNQAVSSIKQGNFPHGVLVECQNSNVGEEFARFIANALVCTGDNKPCSVCPDCVKAQGKGHPDIYETDGIKGKSKNFTVDAIRLIRDDAFVVPNESDKKIYILKNGHNMNEQAQNAILKILEEPPSYVYFIIVTESKSTMLETVLSRVQVYSLLSNENAVTDKELNAVKNIVEALLNVNELALMEQTAVFQKNNQFAKSVLVLLTEVFRDALVKKNGFIREFRFSNETNILCKSLTAKSLLNLISACDELIASIDRNCNNNLLLVRMCYEFKRAIGR